MTNSPTSTSAPSSEAVGAPALRLCPSCGYNLSAERVVTIGALVFDPARGASWRGRAVDMSVQQREIFASLVHARGRTLTRGVIADRIGYEGDDANNIVNVGLCRLRGQLRVVGAPAGLIQTVCREGLRLNLEAANDNMAAPC